MERTLAASDRAAHFVRQLVGFSQREPLQSQALDLNQLVQSSLRVFRRNVKESVEWAPNYQDDLPPILADNAKLVEAISHLVLNALDAMPAGGRLTVSTEKISLAPAQTQPAARQGEFVCLTVRDTRCGIPSENLPRIFEPFFTTKDAGDRCGLGLAAVHGIVKQHQGWTEARSQLGLGTTIKIFLPAIAKPIVLFQSSSPSPAQNTAHPSPEPESNAQPTLDLGPATLKTVFSPNEVRYVPITHWGINE